MAKKPLVKQLLIIADDYGAHDIIDNGIHECIKNGVIDGTDAFVTHESSKKRLEDLLEKYKSKIASGDFIVGLHLTLNVGAPIILVNPYSENDIKYAHFNSYLELISANKVKNGSIVREFKYPKAKGLLSILQTLENGYLEHVEAEMIAQFERFKCIVGQYPSHVSSHNGIFQGTERIYRFMSKFCKENEIRMRCPTLLTFDPYKGKLWKDNPEQDLYPRAKIKLLSSIPLNLSLFNGADLAHIWTKFQLYDVFLQDCEEGLISTNYCIEHFFKNGTIQKLRKILDKVRKDKEENSYELIVHPVACIIDDHIGEILEKIPFGIDNGKGLIEKRIKEKDTLINEKIRDVMKIRGIKRLEMTSIV